MAALTATVTDTAGHRDTSAGHRNVAVQIDENAGLTDAGGRLAAVAVGVDPAGTSDLATAAGGSAPTFTRTVNDNAGHGDAFSRQDTADTADDSAGLRDSTSVPPPITPPAPPPDPPPGDPLNPDTFLPRLIVQMAIGGTTPNDPAASGAFVLGVSQLGVGTLGAIAWVDVTADVQSVTTTPPPGGVTDTAAPASCSVVLDNFAGLYDPDNGATPYAIDVGQHVRVRAEWAGIVYGLFYGYIDDLTPDYGWEPTVTVACTDGISLLGRAQVQETVPAFDGDRTDQRLARILSEADWPASLRLLDPGLATVQADTYGDFALPLAQRVVDSELGEQFVDGDGRYVFFNRTHVYTAARSQTVQALFSDSGTDIDMQGVTASRQRSELYNQAAITRNGDGAVPQLAEDAASRLKYGPQAFPRQAGQMLPTDSAADSLCRWIVARFKQPGVRISDLQINATVQGMWAQLLPLRRADRIRVQRTYGTAAVSIDRQVLVGGIAWTITDAPSWTATISTRPADDFRPFLLGTSTLGTGVLA